MMLPLVLVGVCIDLLMFSISNSCSACVTFKEYLASSYSLTNTYLALITGLIVSLRSKHKH